MKVMAVLVALSVAIFVGKYILDSQQKSDGVRWGLRAGWSAGLALLIVCVVLGILSLNSWRIW